MNVFSAPGWLLRPSRRAPCTCRTYLQICQGSFLCLLCFSICPSQQLETQLTVYCLASWLDLAN